MPEFDLYGDEETIIRDRIAKDIKAYLDLMRPEDADKVLVAWTIGVEWTNSEIEISGRFARDTIAPPEQSGSATVGLGTYISRKYDH